MRSLTIIRNLLLKAAIPGFLWMAVISFPAFADNLNSFEGKKDVALEVTRLFRSARKVVSKNQELINNPNVGDKGLTAEFVISLISFH